MDPSCFYIDAVSNAICFLFGSLVLRKGNGQLAFENQVGCETSVRMWAVVGIGSIGLGEDVTESPRTHFLLGLALGLGCHCICARW